MNRTLTIDSQACTGCGDCSRACGRQLRERPAFVGEGMSRIQVFGYGPLFWIAVCRQCAEAPCADACISGALQVNRETERVELNQEVCIGCGMCVMVCPFGAIWLDMGQVRSLKCDLCLDRSELPCVAACKPAALLQGGISSLSASRRRRTTELVVTPDRRLGPGLECDGSGAGR